VNAIFCLAFFCPIFERLNSDNFQRAKPEGRSSEKNFGFRTSAHRAAKLQEEDSSKMFERCNRPHLWLIRLIGVIVPRRLRADWRQEWEAELRTRELLLAEWDRLDWRNKLNLLRRSLGAFRDALLLQPRRMEDEMFQDIRYGARMLLKSKAFTAVAVLSLALGIGANTALFSVVDAVMLKDLPVSHPEQLVLFRWLDGNLQGLRMGVIESFSGSIGRDPTTGLQTSISISYPAFERFRDQNQTLASVFTFEPMSLTLNANGQAEMVDAQAVSGDYFTGLGVPVVLGRILTNEDDKPGAEPAAVISHRCWQRRFNSDPTAIGKVVYLSGKPFTIVGVMPPGFFGTLDVGLAPEITVSMALLSQVSPGDAEQMHSATFWWLPIMGRLKPGVSAAQAQAELTAIFQRHMLELPNNSGDQRVAPQIRLDSGSQGLMATRERFSSQLAILMAIVGLVLLIACINLASLLLARAASRQKELAVRASVGASRVRLIRQLLTESVLLAFLGGGLGLLFAAWGRQALFALLTADWDEFAIDLRLDWRVLGFTALVSVLTGILFGLAPALRATRIELTPMLKANPGSGGPARSRLSKALVVAQVAMSLLLLAGAGLFVRTLRNLNQIDAGFNRENLLLFRVDPRLSGYETARLANLYQQMTERIAAVPGVRAVTSSDDALLGGGSSGTSVNVPGYTPRAGEKYMDVSVLDVAPNFLATMEIPLMLGRDLTPQDNQQAPQVAVVNQALAERFFPTQNPLGRHIRFQGVRDVEIVGVARNTKYGRMRGATPPLLYLPYLQNPPRPSPRMTFAVRTVGDPINAMPAIRQAVQSIDRNLPLLGIRTQNELIARMFTQERLFAVLSSFFGLLALALVCIGLYGVMSYTVARRTHEIGVRIALGAQSGDLLRMVLRESLLLVSTGTLIGLAAAWATTRLIAGMLFGLTPNDPLTLALATLLLLAVAAWASWLPARRAARVDPLVALREE
jgi:predicted permease